MEITAVEAIPVEVPLAPFEEPNGLAPYVTGTPGYTEAANRTLVRIETANGVTGWGECRTLFSPETTKRLIEDEVAPAAVGKPVWAVESFLADAEPPPYVKAKAILSGVEMAMWDALGRHLDVPLHRLLGGKTTDRVDFAYCLGIWDSERSAERVRAVRKQGFDALKTKVGGYDVETDPASFPYDRSIAADVDRLIAMAEAADGAVALRADANQSWSAAQTTRVGAQLEAAGVDLQYFEQPIRTDTVGAYTRLRQRLTQPIAANEDLYHEGNFYELCAADAVDAGVVDMVPAGGIHRVRKLAALAEEADVSLAHHCGFDLGIKTAAMLHVIATTPAIDLPSDTVYYALADHVIDEPFEFEDGSLPVPETPGLGVSVDEDAVERLRVDR